MKDKIILLIKIITSHIRKSEKFRMNDYPVFDDNQLEKFYEMFIEFEPELTDEILVRIEMEVRLQWNRHHAVYWKMRDLHSCFYMGIRKSIPRTLEQIREKSPWVNLDLQILLEAVDEASMKLFGEPMTFQAGSVETLQRWARGIELKKWQEIVGLRLKYCKDKKVEPLERWNVIADGLHEWAKSETAEFAPYVMIEKYEVV